MAITQIVSTALLISSLMGAAFDANMPDRSINSPLFVVNKQYKLSEDYAPSIGTVSAFGVVREVREDLISPLTNLIDAAKKDGVDLHLVSGFRSFAKQNKVFKTKAKKVGTDRASDVVAIPGASEHQLGLAVDVSYDNWMGINQNLENTRQGKWVRTKGYEHGFVVRYLREYEDVTGYSYEPWHIRFVGIEHAKSIMERGEIPLEHYVSKVRAERFTALEKEPVVWDYPITLDKLLSVYNDEPANIRKKIGQFRNKQGIATDERTQKAFLEMLQNAQQEGITLTLNSIKTAAPNILNITAQGRGASNYLKDNAYIFGFIQQDGNHRYVGFHIAQYMYLKQLSYEDFSAEWKAAYQDFLARHGKVSLSILKGGN